MSIPPIEHAGTHQFVVHRILPVDGRVTVQVGDRVQPEDTVATAALPSAPIVVPVAAGLGVPLGAAARHLTKSPGDVVQAGEVVAVKKSLIGGRELAAPVAGRLIAIESGNLILQAEPRALTLRALMAGHVTAVLPNRGVTLAARGLLVHGVGCQGGESYGRIALWDPLARLDPAVPQVTLVPHLDRATAQEMVGHVAGVVAVTISPAAAAWLRGQARPPLGAVLVLDGFTDDASPTPNWPARAELAGETGALLVADPAWEPGAPSWLAVVRPSAKADAGPTPDGLIVGSQVRALSGPQAGRRGVVTALPKQPVRLDSGHAALVAVVRYDAERRNEPLVNLAQLVEAAAAAP